MPNRQQEDFNVLMERVLAGSQMAARELVEGYGPYILYVVRKRLSDQLRAKFDSRDFEQDVWASFFADLPQRQPFRAPEDLIAFLTSMARNKVADEVRQRLEGQKYNVTRETPLEDAVAQDGEGLAGRQPTPSEVFMGQEAWERLLQSQPPAYRLILIRLREGKTPAETAQELNVSERTVRRVIDRAESWLIT